MPSSGPAGGLGRQILIGLVVVCFVMMVLLLAIIAVFSVSAG
jgi:hypothetical protein